MRRLNIFYMRAALYENIWGNLWIFNGFCTLFNHFDDTKHVPIRERIMIPRASVNKTVFFTFCYFKIFFKPKNFFQYPQGYHHILTFGVRFREQKSDFETHFLDIYFFTNSLLCLKVFLIWSEVQISERTKKF